MKVDASLLLARDGMKKSRFAEEQIIAILCGQEAGVARWK
jgi:hypothetical protein